MLQVKCCLALPDLSIHTAVEEGQDTPHIHSEMRGKKTLWVVCISLNRYTPDAATELVLMEHLHPAKENATDNIKQGLSQRYTVDSISLEFNLYKSRSLPSPSSQCTTNVTIVSEVQPYF